MSTGLILPIGLGLLLVGGFGLWMMQVTGRVPRRFPRRDVDATREGDPGGWRRYRLFYGIMASAGALLLLLHFLMTRLT